MRIPDAGELKKGPECPFLKKSQPTAVLTARRYSGGNAQKIVVGRELAIAGWRVNQSQIRGANFWGKAKTVTQILAIALLIVGWPGGIPCFWVAVVLTLISGLTYLHTDHPHHAQSPGRP